MTTIESARRTLDKRTYVALQVPPLPQDRTGAAVAKMGFVRNLALQAGEVDAVEKSAAQGGPTGVNLDLSAMATLRQFEGKPLPSQVPGPAALAPIPASGLLAFGRAVVQLRQTATQTGPNENSPNTPMSSPAGAPGMRPSSPGGARLRVPGGPGAAVALSAVVPVVSVSMVAVNALNAGQVAVKAFENQIAATPVGMLNLERVEMTPAGIERGELIATIPLAPREQTAVVQKEWSVTTKEFTSIVTDSLENYSETGVTENNELTQSTTSQVQHSNQFNINATVSGSCPFLTATVSTSFGTQDSTSASATQSQKHAKQTTSLASSRVKQEHKTTISTTTVSGTSETTTRTLMNPSDTDPMRIDYFSLMRKWRVRLYRYGLRMTYDLAIPEPGATLRKLFADIAKYNDLLSGTFQFALDPSSITPASYQALATDSGIALESPPRASSTLPPQTKTLTDSTSSAQSDSFAFDIPDGFVVQSVAVGAYGVGKAKDGNFAFAFIHFTVDDIEISTPQLATDDRQGVDFSRATLPSFVGQGGHFEIQYFHRFVSWGSVFATVTAVPADSTMQAWQQRVWQALHDAKQNEFYVQQQTWAQARADLQAKLGADTLTLRREEHDEIMKGVLRWLLGTGFEFMPPDVSSVFTASGGDLEHGVAFTGNDLGISPAMWTTMYQYEEMVKFINEAIEWENVLYYLYSYFWDVPLSWDFIRQIDHPDSTRQAFLRAGSARVVLPVRKGYEQAWFSFVEMGDFGQALQLPSDHPYMTIAEQIQAYDDTNYPGITPANPAAVPVEPVDMAAAVSTDKLAASKSSVTVTVDSTTNFLVGASVTVDTFGSGVQEAQSITAIPDATHITLSQLANAHDGSTTAFPIVQAGENGVVIAEWNEYTPTSGIDIGVTTNLATIA